MSKAKDMPKQGDIITIDAEPHSGKEYGGHDASNKNIRRHMVVISNSAYNEHTGMIIGMPITTSSKYKNDKRFKPILIPDRENGVKGYICLWQCQNYDYVHRNGKIVNHVSQRLLDDLHDYAEYIIEKDSNSRNK